MEKVQDSPLHTHQDTLAAPEVDFQLPAMAPPPMQLMAGSGFEAGEPSHEPEPADMEQEGEGFSSSPPSTNGGETPSEAPLDVPKPNFQTVRHTGVDGESHSVYLEGEEGQETLIAASTPRILKNVLLEHIQNYMSHYQQHGLDGHLTRAYEVVNNLTSLYAKRKINRDAQWKTDVDTGENELRQLLAHIGPHLSFGETTWMVDWIKPPTSAYPPIWIGPKSSNPLLQATLAYYRHRRSPQTLQNIYNAITRTEFVEWVGGEEEAKTWEQFWDGGYWFENMPYPYVEIYYPEGGGTLPDGSAIGLDPANSIYNHIEVPLSGESGSTPGGGKINSLLEPYGFSPGLEGLDGDHAKEIQMGGTDSVANLWPLESSPNRANGMWLHTAKVYDRNSNSMPFNALQALVETGAISGVKLIINIVNDSASERWGWRN